MTEVQRGKNRLEAFSDGVIAIIITIKVLELKVPHSTEIDALLPLWPVFLSFVYVRIYWNKLQYEDHPYLAHRACLTFLKSRGGGR